ncbi:putative solute carrier family 12 member 9-like [Trypanosoma cruzi]|nr:putative solute carrier family 12 member 9-like [Trypanosoma cruzi]
MVRSLLHATAHGRIVLMGGTSSWGFPLTFLFLYFFLFFARQTKEGGEGNNYVLVPAEVRIDPSGVYWGDASPNPCFFFFYVVRNFPLRLDEQRSHVRQRRIPVFHLANNMKMGGLHDAGAHPLRGLSFYDEVRAPPEWVT